jgi:hypothetical protein
MTNAVDKILSIVFFSDLHGVRFTLGLAELIWAITLLWPGETFGRPTYTVMAHVMSENAWGLVFLMSALTQFGILFKGDYHSRFATYFAGWNLALWLYVVISMYLSVSPPPAAISGEAALVLSAGWVWIRSGYEVKGRRASDYGGKCDRRDNREAQNGC